MTPRDNGPDKRTAITEPVTGVPAGMAAPAAGEVIAAECVGCYYADLRDAYAFIFRMVYGGTRFTVYTTSGDRYTIGDRYHLTLTAVDAAALEPEGRP